MMPGDLALLAGATAAQPPAEPPSIAVRLTSLERVMGVLDGRVEDQHLRSAREVTRQITERLSLSPAHTVVALAGATGSGKSSLFNALAGLDLSEVGVRRPVTNAPHACVWGPDGAGPLLDWLSIPYDNRTGRESALDAQSQAELRGLVLLDLPDHDSTQLAHRLEVDRLVELVDLLIWVLDPQKYADEAVHSRYLRRLSRHAGVTLVVLNQVDLLNRTDQEACLADVRRLLDADGLRGVPLVPISALRGDGMPALTAKITSAVASRQGSLQRLAADLDDVATELAPLAGPEVREDVSRGSAKRAYATLTEAAGVSAIGEAVERGYRFAASRSLGWPLVRLFGKVKADPLAPLRENAARSRRRSTARPAALPPVQRPQVEEALRNLSDDAASVLPDPWPRLVHRAARSELDSLPDALDQAVAGADLGLGRRPNWWLGYRVAQYVLLACLFVGTVWVLGIGIAAAVSGAPGLGGLVAPIGLLFGGLLLGPILHLVGMGMAARGSKLARLRAEQAVLDAVTTVARERVLSPVRAELNAYARVREALIEFGVAPAGVSREARNQEAAAAGERRTEPVPALPAPPPAGLGPLELDPVGWAAATANRPDPFGIPPLPASPPDRGLGPAATSGDPRFGLQRAQTAQTVPPTSKPRLPTRQSALQSSLRSPSPVSSPPSRTSAGASSPAVPSTTSLPETPVMPPVRPASAAPPPRTPATPSSPAVPAGPASAGPPAWVGGATRPGSSVPPARRPVPPPASPSTEDPPASPADRSASPAARPASPSSPPASPAAGPAPAAPTEGSTPAPAWRPQSPISRRRERPLPPAPPPRPAVEADPEVAWERSRPAMPPIRPARSAPLPPATEESGPGPSQPADDPEQAQPKSDRRSLRGLLGTRRKDSPDEVERWWAVDDDEENDPFAGPSSPDSGPSNGDRPRVPGQR